MTWLERLNLIGEQAASTNSFAYNPYARKLYYKLLNACEIGNVNKAKLLVKKMGF